jgi:type IV pilus assembly protein PilE
MSIQQPSKSSRAASFGFSLIELMVIVAIIAILTAIALSSYSSYIVKANRSAATGCMSEYANYMERYYTTNLRYDEVPAYGSTAAVANPVIGAVTAQSPMVLDCASTSATGNNYQYSVPAPSATGYIIYATPINAQLKRDKQCGQLTLNQLGARNSNGTYTIAQCWGG